MAVVLFYGLFNMTWSKVSGTSIYPVITWDSSKAWLIGCGALPFFMLIFIF
jgi:hypothetical protein